MYYYTQQHYFHQRQLSQVPCVSHTPYHHRHPPRHHQQRHPQAHHMHERSPHQQLPAPPPDLARCVDERDEHPIAPFVCKLIEMLDAPEEGSVVWAPGGQGFRVLDEDALERRALPRFFKDVSHPPRARHRYASFRRQLNLYGFIKQRKGALAGCYTHPCFRAGDAQLLALITRRKSSSEPLAGGGGGGGGDADAAAAAAARRHAGGPFIDVEYDRRSSSQSVIRAAHAGGGGALAGGAQGEHARVSLPMIFAASVAASQRPAGEGGGLLGGGSSSSGGMSHSGNPGV